MVYSLIILKESFSLKFQRIFRPSKYFHVTAYPCYLPTLDSMRTFHKVPGVRFSRCTLSSCIRFIQVTCGNLHPRCRMNK